MGWFRRRKNTEAVAESAPEQEVAEGVDGGESGADASQVADGEQEVDYRLNGPWDINEVATIEDLVDAGALQIPLLPGAQLQFTTDAQQQNIIGVVYIKDGSALQLQAFAAPKSQGIWDSVRLDMRSSIAKQGGSSQEVVGPFGKELEAQMPLPDSKKFAPHRFLGIDGPRWLLRVSLYGKAGYDKQASQEMLSVLEKLVINRGEEPFPPRELLPLHLPKGDFMAREMPQQ
ncbi:DUF3710 domain-containing protein [Arcanobacterium urinimassiliense]|uniref:DUF3710 domain-containing protein n=1 Tax=Arcanobacterium urinimassiliense TaxID=1871014 RepID=UPI000938D643|nr:DUF3710 domain-containing protein [Arcanobacterium urinimassiliense]